MSKNKTITYELPIGYKQCVDSMLKMYVDGIVNDSEYNHIMNKLIEYHKKKEGENGRPND